jgi:hypothetical protein
MTNAFKQNNLKTVAYTADLPVDDKSHLPVNILKKKLNSLSPRAN